MILLLEELCQLLKEKTGVTVTRATMGRMTQRLKLTFKKKTLHASEKETSRVQTLRVEFWDKIRDVRVEDLIFIDESGVMRNAAGSRGKGVVSLVKSP